MWKKLPTVGVWFMLLALAVANGLLIRQNLQLRTALNRYEPEALQPGDKLPSFSAKGLRDEPLQVNYNGRGPKRVLLYFTPPCPYCRQQFAYWREILDRTDRNRFEVIGLVADSEDKSKIEEYLRSVGCANDSSTALPVALIPEDVRRRYKLTATPITLVITNDGTVEEAWSGRWNAPALARANSIFGLDFSNAHRANKTTETVEVKR
jgi:peroxiredoxin